MSSWQGGPSWGPGDNGTPDWAALAEQSAARARRKRWLMIGGGVLATALVGAIVATAVVTTGGGKGDPGNNASKLPAPADLPEDTSAPAPSFSSVAPPPPPDPKEYISSADKDRAPITVDGFFPGEKLAMGDRVHIKGATGSTTDCATGTQGALGAVLNNNGCEQLIRATYRKEGVAVTVGIAVFDTEAQAKKTVDQASGGLASLSGAGVPTFCRGGTVCRRTTNSYGRYAYFTVGGFTDGTRVTTQDKNVFEVGDDLTNFVFRQIRQRGQVQASQAAAEPAS
ncbi:MULTISPECIES: hypothetical protein [Streptomyces]|uniref:hypothetical protein n=1 Tax=Streptomyces TaxID=1883 RepID=UPI0006AD1052|nr:MULTISPECIES: hypothetical protein [Streptomyces]ALC28033.1 membrane protein [Streptomyces sp. CFMR 7]MBT3076155.1 hypothetical protein [Streptomyces sp. COG21]MBT3079335.1 hypothetical protein [Streptomyces sp. COG20]MBT3086092.1 hypothetical protein [Streptomyces sp. CYG21]MBT3095021.1 hypothetical protein [Streptomyces sp. CBG30]